MSETILPTDTKQGPRAARNPTAWLTLNVIDIEQDFNIREDMGDIEDLADSLLDPKDKTTVKVLELFTVRKIVTPEKTFYILENGHRRYAALRLLEKRGVKVPAVQCIVLEGIAPSAERIYQQLVRNNGKDLTTIEKANAVATLIEEGETVDEIRKRWGVTAVFMADLRKLYTAPKFVREMIADGRLTSYLAIEFMTRFPEKSILQKILSDANTTAQTAASGKGEAAFKILPKHSPALIAARPPSKGRKGTKGKDDQMELIPTVDGLRKSFQPLSAKGVKMSASVSGKLQTVSLVLDALEGKFTIDALCRKLGITKKDLAKASRAQKSA